MAEPIRVLLADDHPLVRSGIRATLAEEPNICIVGEATNGEEAVALCEQHAPDVVLLDLSMPGPTPLVTIADLAKAHRNVRVLVLTAYDDDAYIHGVVRAGVAGYLLKDEATEALVSAVHAVVKGGTWFSRAVVDKMLTTRPADDHLERALELTARERELVEVIGQGWNNRRIAAEFDLAEQTVRNYVSRIYDKLGLRSRAEVVVWARKNGFTDD